jgi:hypothetical protein
MAFAKIRWCTALGAPVVPQRSFSALGIAENAAVRNTSVLDAMGRRPLGLEPRMEEGGVIRRGREMEGKKGADWCGKWLGAVGRGEQRGRSEVWELCNEAGRGNRRSGEGARTSKRLVMRCPEEVAMRPGDRLRACSEGNGSDAGSHLLRPGFHFTCMIFCACKLFFLWSNSAVLHGTACIFDHKKSHGAQPCETHGRNGARACSSLFTRVPEFHGP